MASFTWSNIKTVEPQPDFRTEQKKLSVNYLNLSQFLGGHQECPTRILTYIGNIWDGHLVKMKIVLYKININPRMKHVLQRPVLTESKVREVLARESEHMRNAKMFVPVTSKRLLVCSLCVKITYLIAFSLATGSSKKSPFLTYIHFHERMIVSTRLGTPQYIIYWMLDKVTSRLPKLDRYGQNHIHQPRWNTPISPNALLAYECILNVSACSGHYNE